MHSPTAGVRHRGHLGEPEPEPVKGGRCPTPTEDPDRSGSPAILGKPTVEGRSTPRRAPSASSALPNLFCVTAAILITAALYILYSVSAFNPIAWMASATQLRSAPLHPSCARLPIAAVDRRLREDPGTDPSTHRLLLEALQAGPSQHALSLHLIGGTAPTANRLVAAVAAAVGADHPSCVHLASASRPPKEEAARAGAACPCAVVVWDDVEQVPPFARHDFKFLFDDQPSSLDHPSDPEGQPIDVRGMTFLLLSHRALPDQEAAIRESQDPRASPGGAPPPFDADAAARAAVRRLGLWSDRVNHVIRHHIPVLPAAPH